jgi:hypothetical protein
VNGWDFLRDYFTHTRPESFQSVSLPVISKLHANNTPAEEIDLWTTPTLAQLQIAEVNYASRFEAVDRLRGADYLRYYHDGKSETPSFLALREVARAMYIRARYDLHQGKSERPLHDCESLILLGGLMRHGNLVEHMIGVAIRGIAVDVGHAILVRRRDDRPVVRELLETLEKHRHLWASGLDYDDLRRNEPGFWPIVPMAEIVTPSFQRADTITIRNWSQMEQLRIAAALELYRLDHGDYPEELFLLAPEYLPAIPRDPFRGDEYVYIPGEGGFFELSVTTAEEKLHEPLEFPYPEWVKE